MLPPFIIEQIRQREERERARREEQPRLELPIPRAPLPKRGPASSVGEPHRDEDPDVDRGVVILDLG